MKKLLFAIAFILLVIFGYLYLAVEDDKRWFQEFSGHFKEEQLFVVDFTYFDISPEAYSARVTSDNRLFLKQHFTADSISQMNNNVLYKATIDGDVKKQFDSLIAAIYSNEIDSIYETWHTDGDQYSLYIENESLNKQVYVHSKNPPKELLSLKKLFMGLKGTLRFTPVDTIINFRTSPPTVPPPDTTSSR